MEYPDYMRELMKELSTMEFLKITFKKLHEISIKNEEELLLLDKIVFKSATISKDYKMHLLSPQLQEKFHQRMEDMKLDQTNFLNSLKPYEQRNGPYSRPKVDITQNSPAIPNKATPDNSQAAFSIASESNLEPQIIPSSDNYRAYGNSQRPVERGGMTPKQTRSKSSSSSSSSSDSEGRRSPTGKQQEEISRFPSKEGMNEKTGRLPAKYSFSLKKPDSSRAVRAHVDKDGFFERSSRAYEPRSERGDGSGRERDFRRSPETYYPGRSNKPYRNAKKIYRPPQSYKH